MSEWTALKEQEKARIIVTEHPTRDKDGVLIGWAWSAAAEFDGPDGKKHRMNIDMTAETARADELKAQAQQLLDAAQSIEDMVADVRAAGEALVNPFA